MIQAHLKETVFAVLQASLHVVKGEAAFHIIPGGLALSPHAPPAIA